MLYTKEINFLKNVLSFDPALLFFTRQFYGFPFPSLKAGFLTAEIPIEI